MTNYYQLNFKLYNEKFFYYLIELYYE